MASIFSPVVVFLVIRELSDRPVNSSRAEPKITQCTQCQYLQNHNCAETSKIAAHLKIGTHLPFQFSLCYYHKNEIISKPSKILHKAPIVRTFLWYSTT